MKKKEDIVFEEEVVVIEPPPEPNVVFIGGKHDTSAKKLKPDEEGFVPRAPITKFTDGMEHFKLPPVEDQMEPFYFAEATRLTRLFPQLYKSYVEKGK